MNNLSQNDQWYLTCFRCVNNNLPVSGVNNNSPVSGVLTITYLFQVQLLLELAVQAVGLEELVKKISNQL